MSSINWNSVLKKLNSFELRSFEKENPAYENIVKKAGLKFANVLHNQITSLAFESGDDSRKPKDGFLGATAVEVLTESIHVGEPTYYKPGLYQIRISFVGDLERPSLMPSKWDGVKNIVNLLNTGYTASSAVEGVWKGHSEEPIKSLPIRKGSGFIEQAARDFIGNYGKEYGVVDIEIDNES